MAYWPPFTADTATATCWLAVSDATVENGCMRFVPESHKEAELRHHAPGAVCMYLHLTATECINSESRAVGRDSRVMYIAAPAAPLLQHVLCPG